MSTTNCYRRMSEGVGDMAYLEHRLDAIEARIDDLCGLLGEVLERWDRNEPTNAPNVENASEVKPSSGITSMPTKGPPQ